MHLFKEDYRFAGDPEFKQFAFLLYSDYKEDIKKIVWDCYCTDDDKLMTVGAHFLTEFYLHYDEFCTEIFDVANMFY